MTDVKLRFEVQGFIWQRKFVGQDNEVAMSVYEPTHNAYFYMVIPEITRRYRSEAEVLHLSVGEVVDKINAMFSAREPTIGGVSWKWDTLNVEQMEFMQKTFFRDDYGIG